MEKENFDFNTDVIQRSQDVPVLVDFWSPHCGPCLVLGPVLERLEQEADGKWELIKVNTMFNQELAVQYGIQSIPAVKLFHKGKIINEFVGALPEPTLRQWLDEFVPDEKKAELNEIVEQLQKDQTLGMVRLKAFVEENPDIKLGKLYLGRQMLFEDPTQTLSLLEDFQEGDLLYDNANNAKTLAEILLFEPKGESPANAHLEAARDAMKKEDWDNATDRLIQAIEADRKAYKELGRRGAISLFQLYGRNHPLTTKYQRKFSMALN